MALDLTSGSIPLLLALFVIDLTLTLFLHLRRSLLSNSSVWVVPLLVILGPEYWLRRCLELLLLLSLLLNVLVEFENGLLSMVIVRYCKVYVGELFPEFVGRSCFCLARGKVSVDMCGLLTERNANGCTEVLLQLQPDISWCSICRRHGRL